MDENQNSSDSDMPAEDMSDKNVVTIPMDMLPPGVELKEGDEITFCVQSSDDSGATGYFEPPESGSEDESWEDGLRKEMSPRTPQGDDNAM